VFKELRYSIGYKTVASLGVSAHFDMLFVLRYSLSGVGSSVLM
jgi:hypothetical protein